MHPIKHIGNYFPQKGIPLSPTTVRFLRLRRECPSESESSSSDFRSFFEFLLFSVLFSELFFELFEFFPEVLLELFPELIFELFSEVDPGVSPDIVSSLDDSDDIVSSLSVSNQTLIFVTLHHKQISKQVNI